MTKLEQLIATDQWDVQISLKKDNCVASLNHIGGFSLVSTGKSPDELLDNFERAIEEFEFYQELPIDADSTALDA